MKAIFALLMLAIGAVSVVGGWQIGKLLLSAAMLAGMAVGQACK